MTDYKTALLIIAQTTAQAKQALLASLRNELKVTLQDTASMIAYQAKATEQGVVVTGKAVFNVDDSSVIGDLIEWQ